MIHFLDKMQYLLLPLTMIISCVLSAEYDPLFVYIDGSDGKFRYLSPAYLVDGEFIYDFYSPWPNSHLFTICPNSERVLKLNEIEMGYVANNRHKCANGPVKTSTQPVDSDDPSLLLYNIGYKIYGVSKELISNDEKKSSDKTQLSTQMEKIALEEDTKGGQDVVEPPQEPSSSISMEKMSDNFVFFDILTAIFDAETSSTVAIFCKHLSFNDIYIPGDTDMKNIVFNPNTDVYNEDFTVSLDTLYAEIKERANSKPYPVKRQLVPANEYLLDVWKDVTYHDLNTAPMYNIFVEKWQRIEDKIREILFRLENAHMVAGTSLFPDKSEFKYLKDNMVRIPDLFYKIVTNIHEKRIEGIIIVMHNDPDIKGEPICEDVCEKNNWYGISTNDSEKERAYCCDLNEENLEKIDLPSLLGDFAKKAVFNTMNLKNTLVEAKYINFPYSVEINFLNLLRDYRKTNVINNGQVVTI